MIFSSFSQKAATLSSVFRISSPTEKLMVTLSFSKLIEFRNSTDIYFQNTLSEPRWLGSSTTNNIPGSRDTSSHMNAGNAKSFREYLTVPSFSLYTRVPLICTKKFCFGRLDIWGFETNSNMPSWFGHLSPTANDVLIRP